MAYYGQIPFNTNGGALLSKRNYINRKLDEIEQKLLQLGWIEPEPEQETETFNEEYDIPVESAGALIPYRDKVNKRLDFYEEVIQSHVGYNNYDNSYNDYNDYNNSYNDYYNNSYNNNYAPTQPSTYNNNYNNSYTPSTKPSMYNNYPRQQNIDTTQTKTQEEVSKSFNNAFSDIFG